MQRVLNFKLLLFAFHFTLYTFKMLSLSHTLISLPFAYYLDNPILIFAATFIFHLFADTLLHWNLFPAQSKQFFYPLVAVEVLGGLLLTWLLVGEDLLAVPVLAAIAGGNAPDVLHQLWDFLSLKQKKHWFSWAMPAFRFHDHLQLETARIGKGMVSQVILIVLVITLLQFI